VITPNSRVGKLLRAVGLVKDPAVPIELSVSDQLVLRALFHSKSLTFEQIVAAVHGEWGASRLEILGSLRKLEQINVVKKQQRGDEESFSSTETAKELAARIPARPTVPMNLYI
jgi:hypothetical protein